MVANRRRVIMLKKFASVNPKGYKFLGAKVSPCTTSSHKALHNEGIHSRAEKESKETFGFKSTLYEKDGLSDMKYAEKLISKVLQSSRASPNNRVEKVLESCGKHDGERFRASIGEKIYLWCSGVLAATSALVCRRWLNREDCSVRGPLWLNPQTIQQALRVYIFGIPRERLLLSVKATEDGANCTSLQKSPIDNAAQELKLKTDECTSSILNKLGLQLMTSNQQSQAVELFKAASEAGHVSAIFNMALCFEHGRGVPKDIEKAIDYYKISAPKGHGKSQFNLAEIYANGAPGVEKSDSKAFELLIQAADNGIAKAQVYVGLKFAKQNDQNNAAKFFALAADQKDPVGVYHYGVCYENGWGVQKDIAKAGELYRESAEMGYVSAMYNTAVYYENGFGDYPKSRRLAMDWYIKAADCGDEEARKKFKELSVKHQESKNIMHPLLRDVLTLGIFQEKPKQEKDFHRSRSAPNLGELHTNLKAQNSLSGMRKRNEITEESCESLSYGWSMSDSISSSVSNFSFGLV